MMEVHVLVLEVADFLLAKPIQVPEISKILMDGLVLLLKFMVLLREVLICLPEATNVLAQGLVVLAKGLVVLLNGIELSLEFLVISLEVLVALVEVSDLGQNLADSTVTLKVPSPRLIAPFFEI